MDWLFCGLCFLSLILWPGPTAFKFGRDEIHTGLLEEWKENCHSLHVSLRNANLQANANIRKSAKEEILFLQRELLLGSGKESTVRRRNLQTKAGMTSAAEGITERLHLLIS